MFVEKITTGDVSKRSLVPLNVKLEFHNEGYVMILI